MKIKDILDEFMTRLHQLCPDIFNVLIQIENEKDICFYHEVSFIKNKIRNFFTQDITLIIQTVLLDYSKSDLISSTEKNLEIYDKLQVFLTGKQLRVQDKYIAFKCDMNMSDGLMTFITTFKFIDQSINLDWDQSQKRDIMQKFNLKNGGK